MKTDKFQWILGLLNSGARDNREDDIIRRVTFSNVIFLALPVVYFIFMVIDYKTYFQPFAKLRFDQFIVPIEIGICFFGLWLNKRGHINVSRILFLITWPFFLHLIPIALLHTPPDYYLAFPFGMVFHAVLIQLMISHRKEPLFFWGFILLNFVTLVLVSDILVYFVEDTAMPNELVNDPYYLLDCILYWLLFNLVTYYVLLVIERYIRKLNDSTQLIENQRKELLNLNMDLEKKVLNRTEKLEQQNKKLRGYAYYNAHLLRGPFCRIQGLIQLMGMTGNSEEISLEVMPRLNENLKELEGVISKIRNIIDEEQD